MPDCPVCDGGGFVYRALVERGVPNWLAGEVVGCPACSLREYFRTLVGEEAS